MSILFPEKPKPVVGANEFLFSAVGLAHGHIYGMTHALLNAGATLCEVWDDSPQKVAAFLKVLPQAKPRWRGELISSRQMEGNGTPGTARPPLGHAGYESDYPVRRTVLTGILSSVAYGHC